MQIAIITYFKAEKRASLLFMAVGFAAIAASVFLWRTGSPWQGMAWPLVAINAGPRAICRSISCCARPGVSGSMASSGGSWATNVVTPCG